MSTVKANNHQIGQSGTATNNFTLYQPSTPDGTVRLAVGNSGATTGDVLSVSNTGLSVTGTLSATGNVTLQPGVVISGSSSGDALRITQTGAGNALLVEDDTNPDSTPFVVTAAGDVGIGTSSPARKLQVNSGGAVAARFTRNGGIVANNSLEWFDGTNAWYAGVSGSSFFGIAYNTSGAIDNAALRLDSSGNLGLGVTPSAWNSAFKSFSFARAGSTLYGLTGSNLTGFTANAIYDSADWKYVTTDYASRYQQNSGVHSWYSAPSGTAGNAITFTQAMTLNASGNLGIGTSSPAAQFVVSNAGAQGVEITGSNGAIQVYNRSTSAYGNMNLYANNLYFRTGASPALNMTLDSSGNLGIGVAPSYRLHVQGTSSQQLVLQNVDTNNTGKEGTVNVRHYTNTEEPQLIVGGYSASADNYVYVGGGFAGSNAATRISFYTAANATTITGTERVRIGSGGEVYFPGVGTTASAANAYLDNGSTPANQLLRSTSSLRYKTDVETLDHAKADAVLNLRPVWYRSKAEADRKDWSWYGLIAEEVAQVEPRLVHWSYPEDQFETIETQTEIEKTREVEVTPAVLDDEGNVVEPAVTETETYTETETKSERKLKTDAQLAPDGVQYDRLTVMLLDIVKRQNQRIEQLEAKVAALEAQ